MSSQRLHPYTTPNALAHVRLDSRPGSRRSLTPNGRILASSARLLNNIEGDLGTEDDPRLAIFKDLYHKSESRLASLFEEKDDEDDTVGGNTQDASASAGDKPASTAGAHATLSLKRPRPIDEDDYGDESEGDESAESPNISPLKAKSSLQTAQPSFSSMSMMRTLSQSSNTGSAKAAPAASKTTEEARKRLDEDKKATEDAAKRSFHTLFYTLENDRDAMLEQKKLEELERKVDAEFGPGGSGNATSGEHAQHGTLSQANLGASSLTLKNLIRRIDDHREKVQATDSELRALMSEVRKNRSKWASEDKVGQEELYESLEKVLSELKAHTEHSTHFLNKVNKKEAPDYHIIIKHPMDLGTMTKKMKQLTYRNKKEFVDDLMLIWSNCLKYNANPDHYMRKHALFMRKQTEKLVPLIPEIVIRDRAEVEAEERKLQQTAADLDGEEDSDDEPIISSRSRKAPGKKAKKGTTARKAPAGAKEDTPNADGRPASLVNGIRANSDEVKPDVDVRPEGSQTPPFGSATPTGANGSLSQHLAVAHSDTMDVDNESMLNGLASSVPDVDEEPVFEDAEYKTWKSVTKKDRALVTAERHRLFKATSLDPEAPALLRTKAAMRSWLRRQKEALEGPLREPSHEDKASTENAPSKGETLAEGMEGDEERVLPDYYDPLSAIPDISPRLRWTEDSDGKVIDPSPESFLREIPRGFFTTPDSPLKRKIHENIHQVQKTRKVTTKIGVVKQMALQSQLYQGQFPKTEVVPLIEKDIEPHVISDDGPVVAPEVSRAALQRTTAKLLMHAGFEEFQPSALDAFTDVAGQYFEKIVRDLIDYFECENRPVPVPHSSGKAIWRRRYTQEECLMLSLQNNGADLESLDTYVNEEIDRAGTRLTATHERMKAHLADLLRPALHDAGPDGSGAFNDDSEQFVSGGFAEQLGDDFFGFKELGLAAEFGDASMSVPLHLLQKSVFNANQPQSSGAGPSNMTAALPEAEPYEPITIDNAHEQIGLMREFFLQKLHANEDKPLTEDDDLPLKQRMPKPRLPPNGKITSPRKRPFKEPGPGKGHPRKKMKLNEGDATKISEQEAASGQGDSAGDPVKKEPRTPNLPNGEKMSREPSRTEGSDAVTLNKNLTNGVQPSTNGVGSEGLDGQQSTTSDKGKAKELNGHSLPSPESLGAA